MTQNVCAACDDQTRRHIGKPGETVHVFALRGAAAVESIFQLGLAHAHVVADAKTPALIVGASVGAVHGTAIAEILQADMQLDESDRADPVMRREARLNRFREVLYAYQDFATNLQAALPDPYEADAGRALQPNPQAIHFRAERERRQEALQARSGLITLVNDLLEQTITIRTVTRLLRAWLGWRSSKEVPPEKKKRIVRREILRLVRTIVDAPSQVLKLVMSALHAWVGGTARIVNVLLSQWPQTWLRDVFIDVAKQLEGRHGAGYTAGEIIFGGRRPRIAPSIFRIAARFGLTFLAIIAAAVFLAFQPPEIALTCAAAVSALVGCACIDVGVLHPDFREDFGALVDEVQSLDWPELMLAYYDLLRDFGNDYVVEAWLIGLFDPSYYGRVDMTDVARRASEDTNRPHEPTPDHHPRTFSQYECSANPIHVVPLAADLKTGEVKTIDGPFPIVDGLRAAMGTIPLLRPIPNAEETTWFVDATNVANQPAFEALQVLESRLHPDVETVRLFSVSALTPREPPGTSTAPRGGTVAVARCGLELSRFRDVQLEHEWIAEYNRLIPEESRAPERIVDGHRRALRCFGNDPCGEPQHRVRTELISIEPAVALHTTERFLREGDKNKRQEVLAIAVAEGCRSTLAALYGRSMEGEDGFCRRMLARDPEAVPGAAEVCMHCVLRAPAAEPGSVTTTIRQAAIVQTGSVPTATIVTTIEQTTAVADDPLADEVPEEESEIIEELLPSDLPTTNLLFSGGVFRGVFQIGVLNAMNELGLRPNVIAGSSVGSIVAAMIARVFTGTTRHAEIARLAATFMTLDRLVITDRFADFVRRFTLRAAASHFSLRDADVFFRNYDRADVDFGPVARRVVGGIEHLFYVSPFELSKLVEAMRMQNYSHAVDLVCTYAQEFCDRGLVGFEILGAEPLALLIRQHVLDPERRDRHGHAVTVDGTLEKGGLKFLMTATNLTRRGLRIIGFDENENEQERVALVEALLASSAFPGVFRPRWSREIFFGDNSTDQYIDGGALDNLPLSPVVRFMRSRAERNEIAYRPADNVPHLVMTASLEPETLPLDEVAVRRVSQSWRKSGTRAKRLQYNQKITRFARVQDDLRFLYNKYASVPLTLPVGLETLDIDVVVVKPKWLCGTFGFHPMLGFRREKQAASIAHGCAATFSTIAEILRSAPPNRREWIARWGMVTSDLNVPAATVLEPQMRVDGKCHFRATTPCPFSEQALSAIPEADLHPSVRTDVARIYTLCGIKSTHERPPD
jgi:predicted acylesterase/phospholipase RssA